MTMFDVVMLCYIRRVRLVIRGDELRAQAKRGAINDALRVGLVEHRHAIIAAYGDGTIPDDTLPDELIIPASTPNTIEAISACISEQRVKAAA
jgi:hypothetical protein